MFRRPRRAAQRGAAMSGMRIAVGDRVVIESGYDAWYRYERKGIGSPLASFDSQEVIITGWHNVDGERVFAVSWVSEGVGCAGIPARFVRLIERGAVPMEGIEHE